jgi:hypothetical protein
MSGRRIEFVRAGWGAVLLVAPRAVLHLVRAVRVDRKALVITRILGARQLFQALLSGIGPSPEMLAAGVWVDTVHSMTAFGLAVIDRQRVRVGVVDGVVAALWAGLGLHHLYTGKAQTTVARGRDKLARTVVGALPGGRALMDQASAQRADATLPS